MIRFVKEVGRDFTQEVPTSGAGSGTVTSVAMTVPNIFTILGSPITSSGTLQLGLVNQLANTVWAGPAVGAESVPQFRLLVAADIPNLDSSKITTGTLGVARGGTGAATLTGVLIGNGTSAFTGVAGTSGQILRRNTANTAYEFFTPDYLSNPMTSLGDMIYGNAGGAALRRSGNTTTTKMFLSQTGDGTSSAAPVWEAITAASLGVVPTSRTITINGTTQDLSANRTFSVGTVTSVAVTVPTGLTVTGSPITTTGTIAITFTAGYSIPTTASQSNWDSAYTNRITSLTTTGNSGSATLISNTLNVPTYTLVGLGGMANPFSAAIGQLIYSNSAGAPLSLAPNTTTTKKYLSMTGDGTNGAAPVWEAISGIAGSGTTNYIAKFTASSTIGDSLIYDNGTNVGIGTPTPQAKLDVSGSGTIRGIASLGISEITNLAYIGDRNTTNTRYIKFNRASALTDIVNIQGVNGGIGAANISLQSEGANVGIGTATPLEKLDVRGIILGGSNTSTEGTIILQDQYSPGHLVNLGSNRSSGGVVLGYGVYPSGVSTNAFISSTSIALERGAFSFDGSFRWYTGSSQTVSIGTAATLTAKMLLDNNGNLGVGNLAPQSKLQVSGGGLATSGTGFMVSSQLTNGRLETYDAGSCAAIHTYFDSQTYEISAGSTAGYVSGLVITGRGATLLPDRVAIYTRSVQRFQIGSLGQMQLNAYTSATSFTGTPVAYLACDSSGNIITSNPSSAGRNTRITFSAEVPNTWLSMPAAVTFFDNSTGFVTQADLTAYNQVRLIVNKQATAGAASSKIILRYQATTGSPFTASSYSDIGTSEVSVNVNVANQILVDGWVDMVSGAKDDVWVTILGIDGDGTVSPQFGNIYAEFRFV
jgi:hypothetical protein